MEIMENSFRNTKWEIHRTKVIRYRFMHGSSQRLNDRYNTTEYFTCRNALFCCWGSVVGLALDLVTSRPLCCRRRLTKAAKPTSPAISSRPIVEMTTAVDSDWLKPASILSLYPWRWGISLPDEWDLFLCHLPSGCNASKVAQLYNNTSYRYN